MTLQEYAEWLQGRDLIWPRPPELKPVKATPYLKPLAGIACVVWDIYGTLLRTDSGELLLSHPQQIRMQVALEKTIQEFNMWHSMSRKPGAPWEYMLRQYENVLSELRMAGTKRKGDVREVDASEIWKKLISRLLQNEYEYDESFYGDLDQFSVKVAYFFHSCLQGFEASPGAAELVGTVGSSSLYQGVLADAQPFTLVQLLRVLGEHATLPPLGELFEPEAIALSYQAGVRKPSATLYELAARQLAELGIEPSETLYVSCCLRNDLSAAKRRGFRTALYAADKNCVRVEPSDMKDPELRPDRLLTELTQVRELLQL